MFRFVEAFDLGEAPVDFVHTKDRSNTIQTHANRNAVFHTLHTLTARSTASQMPPQKPLDGISLGREIRMFLELSASVNFGASKNRHEKRLVGGWHNHSLTRHRNIE